MKIRNKSIWMISGLVSAAVVTVFLIRIGASDRDATNRDRIVADDRSLSSAGASPADRLEAVAASSAGEVPEWPGLPAADYSQPGTASPLPPEPADDEFAPDLPLIELMDSFDDLEARQRAEAAYRIASGWFRCRLSRAVDGADLWEVARRRYENSLRIAEANMARSDDEARVAEEIDRIASVDRETAISFIHDEIEALNRFCGGIETRDLAAMNARAFEWIDRAAALGYSAARVDYVYHVFDSARVTPGKASRLMEDKRRVVEYVHGLISARDVRALELLGYIVQEGFFEPPNPEHAYAYTSAALEIRSNSGSTAWRVPTGDNDISPFLRWRRAETAEKLDGAALSRAEAFARRIVEMSR